MPRRTRPKKIDKQYKPKKGKRPRAWHRKAKKPVWKIWLELQKQKDKEREREDQEREGAVSV